MKNILNIADSCYGRQYFKKRGKLATYHLTISSHQMKRHVTTVNILDVINHMMAKLDFDIISESYRYECHAHYYCLHVHCMAIAPLYLKYKKYNSLDGFRFQWERTDKKQKNHDFHFGNQWAYCVKQDRYCSQLEAIMDNFIRHTKPSEWHYEDGDLIT